MTRIVAVIPGRMESARFPGKMLAAESGMPLIVHCVRNAARATLVDAVCIASDSAAIEASALEHGIDHHMTRPDHANGTSRIAEIAADLDADIIVNVQGDEPELEPEVIDAAIDALLADNTAAVATAASPITDPAELTDPNVVKVVLDSNGRALYFSRAAIGHDRDAPPSGSASGEALRHVGLYVYRPEALLDYVALPEGALERAERLEQLRLLEHGRVIAVARVKTSHAGIDTPEQYASWIARRQA